MPGPNERDSMRSMPFRLPNSSFPERRSAGFHVKGKQPFRHRQVDRRDCVDREIERLRLVADLSAQHVEDTIDLVLLGENLFPPSIVQLDHVDRLDEQCLTTRRCVMDNTGYLRSGFGL